MHYRRPVGGRRLARRFETDLPVPRPREVVRSVQERLPLRRKRSRTGPVRLGLPFALAAAFGAVVAFFFDPQQGTRRRKVGADRLAGAARRAGRRGTRVARGTTAHARGWSRRAVHGLRGVERPVTDDGQLLARVESMVFRSPDVPKGRLNVSVENCVVVLRGELDSMDQVRDVEQRVKHVPGVHDVENLLHVAGTPAPNKAAAQHASVIGRQN